MSADEDDAQVRAQRLRSRPLWTALALMVLVPIGDASAQAGDPVVAFSGIVKACQVAHELPTPHVFYQPSISKWVKRVEFPLPVRFDVRKTDSLVSPVVAYIESTTRARAVFVDTEEQARELEVKPEGDMEHRVTRLNFTFRDGAWVFVSANASSTYRRGDRPSVYPLTLQNLRKEGPPWSACVGD